VGQEIGVHCYEHRLLDAETTIVQQLTKALRILQSVGLHPQGFAAPYGYWTPSLGHAIEQLGFRYSSEFAYVYDSLPMATHTRDRLFSTLQVPIHPICIGSLLRAGYSVERTKHYYRNVTDRLWASALPLLFYHHPSHRSWDVIADMLTYARKSGVVSISMGDYARWWLRRAEVHPFVSVEARQLHLEPADRLEERDIGVCVSFADGREARIPPKPVTDLHTLYYTRRAAVPRPPDIRRIREFDPRRVLGDVYNSMLRRIR
jgi:hypothetical protein